jgi:hypothetical protein
MGRPQDDVNGLRVLPDHRRQGVDHRLDALAGREQPEGQYHLAPLDAVLVLVKIGIDNGTSGCRGESGRFFQPDTVMVWRSCSALWLITTRRSRVGDALVTPSGLASAFESPCAGGHQGHAQAAEQVQDMDAVIPAENPEFVLEANHLHPFMFRKSAANRYSAEPAG